MDILALIPLGVVGALRWLSWAFRRVIAMFYRPIAPGFTAPLSVVVPVYQEDPALFRTALDSWLDNPVHEVILVVDTTDSTCLAIGREYEATGRVRVVPTDVPGKRDALSRGYRLAETELVALVDSDTIWAPDVLDWVTAPFADPEIGGVGTRQNVHRPRGLLQNVADMYLDYRYFDEIAGQTFAGQAVSCLSGRTAVYRRALLLEHDRAFLTETFLGTPCMSGDDKRLTTLILEAGHKTVLQREARVWSTFPAAPRLFVLQRVRWARNTWRSDLRAMRCGWIWKHRYLAFTTVDKAISSFTLLISPIFLGLAFGSGHERSALILLAWWLLSRGVKLLPHFRRRPVNLLRLPLFIPITIAMALLKLWALATVTQHRWLTRDVAVVDGQVVRTGAAAEVALDPAVG